jgi:hypothetical protein
LEKNIIKVVETITTTGGKIRKIDKNNCMSC